MAKIYPFEEETKNYFKNNKPNELLSKRFFFRFVSFAFPIFQAIWTITIVLTARGLNYLSEFTEAFN
jgi:hypothetical protein